MIDVARKASKQLEKSIATLTSALGVLEEADALSKPFAAQTACAEALESLRSIRELTPVLLSAEGAIAPLEAAARDAAERRRARFAGELAEALAVRGLTLTGRLPTLECGSLTIEFAGTTKPEIKVYYGPKVELLDTVAVDAALVAKSVAEALAELDTPLDEAAFLAELHEAWRLSVARHRLGPGEKAQIVDVLGEMAFGRQSAAFRSNPTGKGFTAYGRLRFAHDLGRLKTRRFARGELALGVATRDQTKRPIDHLWVAGTHFSQLSFRDAT